GYSVPQDCTACSSSPACNGLASARAAPCTDTSGSANAAMLPSATISRVHFHWLYSSTRNMAASLTGTGRASEGAQQLHEPFFEIQVDHVVQGGADRREIRRHFGLPIAHDPRFRAAVDVLARQDHERRTGGARRRARDAQPLDPVLEALHRHLGDEAAVVHDADPVADAPQLVDQMTGDEDRRLPV